MKIFIVDAFTTRHFCGNQAGVALLEGDFPTEGWMRALAGELKHSETAFVRQTGAQAFHIRYFTPSEEVDLCGHATIAAFTVLREEGVIGLGQYALATRSGALTVEVGADAVWMDMAKPKIIRDFSPQEQAMLYGAYGLTPQVCPPDLAPQAVSTGLADIMLPVATEAQLAAAVQNEGEVARLSEQFDVVGVHMFCLAADEMTAHCRNFAPRYAIPEEAATGTSNGALTYYLYRRGLVAAGGENCFLQGESMGKPSEILSCLTETADGAAIRVGGTAVVTLRCHVEDE